MIVTRPAQITENFGAGNHPEPDSFLLRPSLSVLWTAKVRLEPGDNHLYNNIHCFAGFSVEAALYRLNCSMHVDHSSQTLFRFPLGSYGRDQQLYRLRKCNVVK